MKHAWAVLLALLCVCSCTPVEPAAEPAELTIGDMTVAVDETAPVVASADATYTFDGDGIAIFDGHVRGMVAGSVTVVTAAAAGYTGTFTVTVTEDRIAPSAAETVDIAPVSGLSDAFAMGMDVSTLAVVLQNGGKFYDESGNRVSVYKLLADHGVNYLRLRLWNEPYQIGPDGVKRYYGGGNCDLATVTDIARTGKALGFSFLLDFHYSDFWADPGRQIIPKMWADIAAEDDMARAIYDYTYETLRVLDAAGALPDMVQIGNELTSGMFLETGGQDDGTFALDGFSRYVTGRTTAAADVRSAYTGHGAKWDARLVRYVSAGAEAVKAYAPDTPVMLHYAGSMDDKSAIKRFFHTFDAVGYDVIGLSYYPRWHGTVSELTDALADTAKAFPDKTVCVAEVSYAYTLTGHPMAGNQFNNAYALDGYAVSVQGQTTLLRDVIAAVAACGSGFGVFYWEGCWLPVDGAGWASEETKSSWANQALFDYNGRVLPSLAVFKRVRDL